MKAIFFLKMLVFAMTTVLVVGFGFIVYGLVTQSSSLTSDNPDSNVNLLPQKLPQYAQFRSYHFHGDTITLLYECGDSIIFYSIYENGRKNFEIVKGVEKESVNNECSP